MKKKSFLALVLALALLASGCGDPAVAGSTDGADGTAGSMADGSGETAAPSSGAASSGIDTSDLFSNRDFETGYEESESARIELSGDCASCDSNAVQISGSTVTITDEGTYILSGSLDDGMIIVNTEKSDKTQLVLDGVTIHSETSAPIYILQSDKVFITLAEGSVNTLSNGGTFTAIDENNIDAVIFSKEDLTLNGSGSLSITSPAGHGIVSKDELTLTGGTYEISTASHGLSGKDNICITNAVLEITAGKDGIHAENDDDPTLGFVFIESGTFDISAEGDGISAGTELMIGGGSFRIVTGGGSVNAQKQTSDSWGGFKGGNGRPGARMGGFTGTPTTSTEDSTSIKGLKSGGDMTICGGDFTIDSADDAVHSNAGLTVSGGTFEISTGDDGFHADETLRVTAGTINITESYEGLEGLCVDISGGDIRLVASDDGLNAAGGTDASGFGGFRGKDTFGSASGSSSGSTSGSRILISGGTVFVNASGDGLDSNGTLEISGGTVTVSCPGSGDTSALDYDASGTITGGTFIGTGAYQMAQTFSSAGQGVIALSVGSQAAGTLITLTDGDGNTLISYEPNLSFAIVILSCPEMVKGQTYTVTVGSLSGDFDAG